MPLGEIRGYLGEPGRIIPRLLKSAVVWSWGFNLLRLAGRNDPAALVLRIFSKPELGMYYVLLSLSALGRCWISGSPSPSRDSWDTR